MPDKDDHDGTQRPADPWEGDWPAPDDEPRADEPPRNQGREPLAHVRPRRARALQDPTRRGTPPVHPLFGPVVTQDGRLRPRLTVVETVSYARPGPGKPGQNPAVRDLRHGHWLEGDGAHVDQEFEVGGEWLVLPTGHLKGASCLVLENLEGTYNFTQTIPEPEEAEAVLARVVDVAVGAGDGGVVAIARLRPGRSMRYEPQSLADVRLRSPAGPARVRVFAVPG